MYYDVLQWLKQCGNINNISAKPVIARTVIVMEKKRGPYIYKNSVYNTSISNQCRIVFGQMESYLTKLDLSFLPKSIPVYRKCKC